MDSSAEAVLTRLEALEAAVRRGLPAAPSSLPEPAESGEKAAKHLPQKKKEEPSPLEQAAAEEKASAPILADLSDAHPFGEWQEVLGRLLKTNPPLFAALKNSDAYEKGDLMLKMCIRDRAPSDKVLALKGLEAFGKAADGKATKIIIPSEIQNLAGLATSVKELMTDGNITR